jgi:hypothetical protein
MPWSRGPEAALALELVPARRMRRRSGMTAWDVESGS